MRSRSMATRAGPTRGSAIRRDSRIRLWWMGKQSRTARARPTTRRERARRYRDVPHDSAGLSPWSAVEDDAYLAQNGIGSERLLEELHLAVQYTVVHDRVIRIA